MMIASPVILIVSSAILLFAHNWMGDRSASWYFRGMFHSLSLIFMCKVAFDLSEIRNKVNKEVFKWAIILIIAKSLISIYDGFLAYVFDIHEHKRIAALQYIPISIIVSKVLWVLKYGKQK